MEMEGGIEDVVGSRWIAWLTMVKLQWLYYLRFHFKQRQFPTYEATYSTHTTRRIDNRLVVR